MKTFTSLLKLTTVLSILTLVGCASNPSSSPYSSYEIERAMTAQQKLHRSEFKQQLSQVQSKWQRGDRLNAVYEAEMLVDHAYLLDQPEESIELMAAIGSMHYQMGDIQSAHRILRKAQSLVTPQMRLSRSTQFVLTLGLTQTTQKKDLSAAAWIHDQRIQYWFERM